MKKLLALVLALVMSMSLVTISNAAFKDADKIDYKEAVDVMNAVGVFVGDEKGNFNAKENLTREQAAKIIAYLELGSKAADALAGGATFTDVASTRWSAGFVGYCAQAGVVNGVGNSKFDPAGQLTALQFGKMLLVELGYDAKAEGMVGTDWAINTSKLMAKAKLMDKIDGSVNQVLTREKAAQMTLNALKAPTVEYTTKGSSISVNGAEINLGASEPTYVTNTIAKQQTISDATLTNNGGYTIELGEKLYTKLKLSSGAMDDFGRPIHIWTNDTKKIGEYAEDEDAKYTDSVKLGTIYADLGLSNSGIPAGNVTYYVDGEKTTFTKDIVKGSLDEVGGNGAAFGSVGKLLVTAVIELHRSLRGIATRGMHVHQQLPVPHRKLRVGGIGKVVLVEAVARGADDLHGPVALQAQFQSPHRLDGRGAARVARTIVMVNGIQRIALGDALQVLAMAEVFVTPLGRIVVGVHHGHDTRTVHALPQADLERNLARTMER